MKKFDDFRENGFCNVGSLLAPSQLGELLEFAASGMPEARLSSTGGSELLERFPFILYHVVLKSKIIDFMISELGEGARLNSCSLVKVGGQSTLDWHRDIFGAVPVGEGYQRPTAINLLIYLQDVRDDNGSFVYLPRSHVLRTTLNQAQKQLTHTSQINLHCKAGEGLAIHNCLLHSRGVKQTGTPRVNLSLVFSACYVKPNMDFAHALVTKVREACLNRGLQKEAEMLGDLTRYRELINNGFIE